MSYQQFKIFSVKLKNKNEKFPVTKLFYGIAENIKEAMHEGISTASRYWEIPVQSIEVDEVTFFSCADFVPPCISGKGCIVCQQ
jgi:hypothetical protein